MTPKLKEIPSQKQIDSLVDHAFYLMVRNLIFKKFGLEGKFREIEPESCGARGAGALSFVRQFLALRKIDLGTVLEIPLGKAGAKADMVTLVEVSKDIPPVIHDMVRLLARQAGEADAEADLTQYLASAEK